MEEWKEYKATDFCKNVTDGTHDSPKQKSKGYYLITSKHIKGNTIDFDSAYKISEEDYNKIIQRSKVDQWDVIISMIGAYCGFCYLEKSTKTDYAIKNVGLFKVGSEIKSKWLYYYLTSPAGQYKLHLLRTGSSQPYIALNSLRNITIPVPDEKTMRSIVSVLQSLDEKIEVNMRINDNLEQQAQALFKSWFVDFEPFKDQPFVESELGMIPQGWRVGTLGEICTQSSVKVGIRNNIKVLSPVTAGCLMLSEDYFTKQVFSESIAKYKVVERGAFAYNPARVNIGSLGRNEFDFDGCVSPVYVVFVCKDSYANYFDLFRATERFKTEVSLRAIGGVRQSLNFIDFAMIQTIIAPKDVVDAFNPLIEKLKVAKKHLDNESRRLAELRDTLLPRLMSGELSVNDIKE